MKRTMIENLTYWVTINNGEFHVAIKKQIINK
jgi:hypothetical protein